MTDIPREEWLSALCEVPEAELNSVTNRFSPTWKVEPKALPQAGLGMLKMCDSTLGDTFYLGEFPLATCWITVKIDDLLAAEGAALVMDDDLERAEKLALCDAVLSAQLEGWMDVEKLLIRGMKRRQVIKQERKLMLSRTRVDFSLLDDVGDEDA